MLCEGMVVIKWHGKAFYIGYFGTLSEGKGFSNPIGKRLTQGRNQVGFGIGISARI